MTNLVEIEDLSKHYRLGSETVHAVRNVNLTIAVGDFVAIVGPSGSGKTTLMNLIGCVDKADSGTLRIEGEQISGLTDRALTAIRARKIGFVFQQFFLLPTLTAQENVLLPALFAHAGDRSSRAAELLESVGLAGRSHHLPAQLSGGEMQRVAIARAMINDPKILIADEPTGNLDSHNAEAIMTLLESLNAAGHTIVMVTHNLDLIRERTRVYHMRDGELSNPGRCA